MILLTTLWQKSCSVINETRKVVELSWSVNFAIIINLVFCVWKYNKVSKWCSASYFFLLLAFLNWMVSPQIHYKYGCLVLINHEKQHTNSYYFLFINNCKFQYHGTKILSSHLQLWNLLLLKFFMARCECYIRIFTMINKMRS